MNAPDIPWFLQPRPHNTDELPVRAPQPCDQLPPPARDLLVLASQVADPRERRIAIDHAIDRIRARFPELFHPQP